MIYYFHKADQPPHSIKFLFDQHIRTLPLLLSHCFYIIHHITKTSDELPRYIFYYQALPYIVKGPPTSYTTADFFQWITSSIHNYFYARDYLIELAWEHYYRFKKVPPLLHAIEPFLYHIPPPPLPDIPFTPPPIPLFFQQLIPKDIPPYGQHRLYYAYKYLRYYFHAHLSIPQPIPLKPTWTIRPMPNWLIYLVYPLEFYYPSPPEESLPSKYAMKLLDILQSSPH